MYNSVELGRLYDAIYREHKDYEREATDVSQIIDELGPDASDVDAKELLDVACGTGLHLEHLRSRFIVEGLDLSEGQLAIAHEKLPEIPLHQGDMTGFDLDREYDVITCLFGAIGELSSTQELDTAIGSMAKHLSEDGLLIIEPWLLPEKFVEGRVWSDFVDREDLKVSRMALSERSGSRVKISLYYLVGCNGTVSNFEETLEETMHSIDDVLQAYRKARLLAFFDEEGLAGRGLFVGISEDQVPKFVLEWIDGSLQRIEDFQIDELIDGGAYFVLAAIASKGHVFRDYQIGALREKHADYVLKVIDLKRAKEANRVPADLRVVANSGRRSQESVSH